MINQIDSPAFAWGRLVLSLVMIKNVFSYVGGGFIRPEILWV
jgi:hypothetical protein